MNVSCFLIFLGYSLAMAKRSKNFCPHQICLFYQGRKAHECYCSSLQSKYVTNLLATPCIL